MINTILPFLTQFAAPGDVNCGNGTSCATGLPDVAATSTQLNEILQLVLVVFGAIAVLVIVFSGLRMVTSQGNPQEIAKARNILLYAVIGLVFIAGAEAIVAFVLGHV